MGQAVNVAQSWSIQVLATQSITQCAILEAIPPFNMWSSIVESELGMAWNAPEIHVLTTNSSWTEITSGISGLLSSKFTNYLVIVQLQLSLCLDQALKTIPFFGGL